MIIDLEQYKERLLKMVNQLQFFKTQDDFKFHTNQVNACIALVFIINNTELHHQQLRHEIIERWLNLVEGVEDNIARKIGFINYFSQAKPTPIWPRLFNVIKSICGK